MSASHPANSLRPPWVQRSLPSQVTAPNRQSFAKHAQVIFPNRAEAQPLLRPKTPALPSGVAAPAAMVLVPDGGAKTAASPAPPTEVAAVKVSTPPAAPPPPTVFKTLGYVEKAGGQLEAIILQENQIQVVHIGDRIADRYRVTKITPDSVDALDETLVQPSMAKSGGAESEVLTAKGAQAPLAPAPVVASARPEVTAVATGSAQPLNTQSVEPLPGSLGYVQQGNGKVIAVVGDGESVKLVLETPAETMAQAAPPASPGGTVVASAGSVQILPAGGQAQEDGHAALLPEGYPEASAIRRVSYQVPEPAVQGAAPMGFSLNSAVEPSVMNAASGLGAFNLTARSAGETERVGKLPVEIKPLGYVVKGDGQFAAIVSADDDVYVVRPGDRFAGRYRALSVSADLVEAVEDPPRQPPVPSFMAPADFPDLLSASAQQRPPLSSGEDCGGCKFSGVGEVSAKVPQRPPGEVQAPLPRSRMGLHTVNHHGQGAKAPKEQSAFIFQTLGTVETQDGQVQAIVADGSQLYLVKQGETFADQYQATSVDPLLVLAVKLSPGELVNNSLVAQTESGGRIASNNSYGLLHSSPSGAANFQIFSGMVASGSPILADLGVNLFNSSSTGINY